MIQIIFYISSLVALINTICIFIYKKKPIYSVIFFILSSLNLSFMQFSIGAFFSGSMSIIIYSGAIMVMFLFIIMILNVNEKKQNDNNNFLNISLLQKLKLRLNLLISLILIVFLFVIFIYFLLYDSNSYDNTKYILYTDITSKMIGQDLFSSYIFIVELASILMLSGLIISIHLSYNSYIKQSINNTKKLNL